MKAKLQLIILFVVFIVPLVYAVGNNNIRIDRLGTVDYLFPIGDGDVNQVLATNGVGQVYWRTVTSGDSNVDLNGYVPYQGANEDVNLNAYGIKASYYELDTNLGMAYEDSNDIIYIGNIGAYK